jgi:hypothetical protein
LSFGGNIMNFTEYEIVPLGVNCAAAHFLRRQQLRKTAYPFDWIVSPISSVAALLDDSFLDYFNEVNFEYLPVVNRTLYNEDGSALEVSEGLVTPVICKKYKLLFPHDFSDDASEEFDRIKGKYSRRVERLHTLLRSKGKLLFIVNFGPDEVNQWQLDQYRLAGVEYPLSSDDDVRRLHQVIAANYSELDFKIMTFSRFKKKYRFFKRWRRFMAIFRK